MAINDNGVQVERQYIGARYVPKFFENPDGSASWLAQIPYEPLTIVTYLGNSYTSKIPVPPSDITPNNDKDHWVLTSNFSAQLQSINEQISSLSETIDGLEVNAKIFNNVDSALTDENLKVNDIIITAGYYTPQDGGAMKYYVSETTSTGGLATSNGMFLIPIIGESHSVLQFGAHGDGMSNDTPYFTIAVTLCNDVFVPAKLYAINSLVIPSNTKLHGKGTLTLITSETTDKLIRVDGVENVIIDGLTLEGDRGKTGNVNEYKHCIYIQNAKNVTVSNCKMSSPRGDGISCNAENVEGQTPFKNTNIVIENCSVDNAYRNGVSVTACDGMFISKLCVRNTNGMNPGMAIDIEPNHGYQTVKIFINDLFSSDNHGGCLQARLTNSTGNHQIIVSNVISNYDGQESISIDKGCFNFVMASPQNTGNISCENVKVRGAYTYPFLLTGAKQNQFMVKVNAVIEGTLNNKSAFYIIPDNSGLQNNFFDLKALIKSNSTTPNVKTAAGNINGGFIEVDGYTNLTELSEGTKVNYTFRNIIAPNS